MKDILEIEFKGRRKEYALNPMQFPFVPGDAAIVDVDRGLDLAKVSYLGIRAGLDVPSSPGYQTLRKATTSDLRLLDQNREREVEARQVSRRKVQEHHLDMKVVDVELQWDGRKMTVYFTAEGRVDFRELVKDLATAFRTRIDLRQIGARDETKREGGYGVCGRPLCCSTFLQDFKPITTQMPRDQFLPLNPTKLSGVCGRLKCCLRYELDVYREFQRNCPKVGQPIKDEARGQGVIDKLDMVREQIQVRWGDGEIDKFNPKEFVQLTNWRPEMPKNECICTCGKRPAAATPPQTKKAPLSQIESAPISIAGAEKVTLIAGGGLGLTSEKGEEVRFGSSVDAEAKVNEAKKKRRKRRRKKRPGEQAPAGTSSAPTTPDSGDDGDDGDDEE